MGEAKSYKQKATYKQKKYEKTWLNLIRIKILQTFQVFVQLLIIFGAEDFELESSAVYWATVAGQYLEKHHSLEPNKRCDDDGHDPLQLLLDYY